MCGICGKYSPKGVEPQELRDMLRALAHRGPDDEGIYLNGCIGLGNRRLSIIDLAGGHQPICNEDGTVWIAYNGEIYNYNRLRHRLEGKGHVFRTRSDTEVIVHLYEELGERCVNELCGMFAFAIWDENQRKLLLVRDRLGQKPLFYAQRGRDLLFASEVKGILAALEGHREIDYESLHHYLSLRFIPSPHTMLRDIQKLPAAHTLTYQDGQVTVSRYWDLSFLPKLELSEPELIRALGDRLKESVASHLVSDVPVGALLSGGLDSSMVVALMAEQTDSSFKTFSIGVEEQDFDELPYARVVADQYGTCHTEERVAPDLVQLLPQMVWHLDEPSDPIAACQFHAAALAARHVKVVLGGDGGDELFAGFDRYLGIDHVDYYAAIPAPIRRNVLGPLLARVPDTFAYKSLTQKLRWMHQLAGVPDAGGRYAEATCFFRFSHDQKQALYGDSLRDEVGGLDSSRVIADQYDRAEAVDPLDRMLYADYMTRVPEHSLMLVDRMTMAHGLEARSPYLDHELVEFMAAVPAELKIRGRQLKYILRQLAIGYLPHEIVQRSKQGFMFPIAYWFRDTLYAFLEQILLGSYFVQEGLFQKANVMQLLQEHRSGRIDHHVRLWMLLNLEVWHQIYMQGQDRDAVTDRVRQVLATSPAAGAYA